MANNIGYGHENLSKRRGMYIFEGVEYKYRAMLLHTKLQKYSEDWSRMDLIVFKINCRDYQLEGNVMTWYTHIHVPAGPYVLCSSTFPLSPSRACWQYTLRSPSYSTVEVCQEPSSSASKQVYAVSNQRERHLPTWSTCDQYMHCMANGWQYKQSLWTFLLAFGYLILYI